MQDDYRLDADDPDALDDGQLTTLATLLWSAAGDDCVPLVGWPYRDDQAYWCSLLKALRAHGLPRRVIVQMLMAVLPDVSAWAEREEWCFMDVIM